MGTAFQLIAAGKRYLTAAGRFDALKPLDLEVVTSGCVGVLGPSGSGKSTLLNLIAGIDWPSTGRVVVDGQDLATLSESRLAAFRGRTIGIVFQFFQLIPTLTVIENVLLAMDLVGTIAAARRRDRALALLSRVGVDAHRDKLPQALSGGEQQRVAIARALANDPPLLVADEPTGNLDSGNGELVHEIFQSCADEGRTVLVATHDSTRLDRFNRVIRLADGTVVEDRATRR